MSDHSKIKINSKIVSTKSVISKLYEAGAELHICNFLINNTCSKIKYLEI